MKVHLLFSSREWNNDTAYFDRNSIQKDLGLSVICRAASREIVEKKGEVSIINPEKPYLTEVIGKVMLSPLQTEEEIYFRQEILKDCLAHGEFINSLFQIADETIEEWDKIGREEQNKSTNRDSSANLITRYRILHLFTRRLSVLKSFLSSCDEKFASDGINNFITSFCQDYTDKMEQNLNKILTDLNFFAEEDNPADMLASFGKKVNMASIVMECDISNGLKLNMLELEKVETHQGRRKKRKKSMSDRMLGLFADEPGFQREDVLYSDVVKLENNVVKYLVSCCESFVSECKEFFEQLHFQSAFYKTAYNLQRRMERQKLAFCFPIVGKHEELVFDDLIELSMATYHNSNPVGNSVDIKDKMLCIITGANQGGKSTFLRSIGIAQIMFQCGLFVAANSFRSGLFPNIFTHFTRREDSEMNSGRLDEELKRIDDIIRHLDKHSLILLNESFATTTEKEGSLIAYDIIRALNESGVKLITVTHLLSFAQKVYKEDSPDVEFLCAERKDDGKRTFKMIQSKPELTSFGLDLYEEMEKTI